MSTKVFSPINSAEKDKWYDLAAGETTYRFPVSTLPSRGIIELKAYEKSDTFVTFTNVTFLDSASAIISTYPLLNLDTTSTRGHSSIVLQVPSNAVYFLIGATDPSYVLARAVKLEPITPLTPIRYTNSQNITITNSANVALLGGGGAGGSSTTNTATTRGGAGSGYLTHASVSPGNYALTIGAGGTTASAGNTGGTTSFAGSNAAGGVGTGGNDGANGGSGGGDSSSSSNVNSNGGFNGGNAGTSGGLGSGVTANLFTPGAGGAFPGGAGGVYGGGAGATNTPTNQGAVQGQSGAPGSGAGGGGSSASVNTGNRSGGNGGSGALWVLES